MNLGIDFGTTRTVVALADRGNYPVIDFADEHGDHLPHFPTVTALTSQGLVHGFAALEAARGGAPLLRSVKRLLSDPALTLDSAVDLGGRPVLLLDLVTDFLVALRTALAESSTLAALAESSTLAEVAESSTLAEVAQDSEGAWRAVVGVPAHAHTAQRMLTLEAFRRAGFEVVAMLNEPSAAGFEFTDRARRNVTSRRNRVVVYDLGGGTFDASLVAVDGSDHEVLGSRGVNRLGGDDFDLLLADLVLQRSGRAEESLSESELDEVVEQCRQAKESLTPQTRRMAVDVAGSMVTVEVKDFYELAAPLVEQSLAAMEPLVSGLDGVDSDIAGIYVVGGSSSLPLVPRVLRERFGRRVHRSPYPGASTAIGLAIASDPANGFTLAERLSRGFGVFREGDAGREVRFDAILQPDHRVGVTDEVVVTRRYRAAHTVGWFRFVEYGRLDAEGQPVGELSPYGELLFAFDPSVRGVDDLRTVPVERLAEGHLVEESYTVDQHGIITVRITDLDDGFTREVNLG